MGMAVSVRRPLRGALIATVAFAAGAPLAYYDHTAQYEEAPGVVARFPDPAAPLATPGFKPKRVDFTSHPEILKFLDDLAKRTPDMRVATAGRSIEDRAIALAVFAHPASRTRPRSPRTASRRCS